MNKFREQYLEDRKKASLALYEIVKDDPKPEISDLWSLEEEYFIEWRKNHDFPKLLKHFDDNLLLFKEWKSDTKLTDDLILSCGELTPFLEHKKLSKKKKLYLIEQTFDGEKRNMVSYTPLTGVKNSFGTEESYKPILEFYSYLDWLKKRQKSATILGIKSRNAPGSDIERVFIHANLYSSSGEHFELLKMGGIDVPTNAFNVLLRGKRLEFVNLCGLRLNGEIYFGEEGNLSCSYCACDNMVAKNLDMSNLDFEHCSIKNVKVIDSKIQQWRFYDCQLTGEFNNSQLRKVTIWGGLFDPIMKGCNISDVEIEKDKSVKDLNYPAYQSLKKLYAEQGDDPNAIKYFIKEQEYIRKRSKGIKYLAKSVSRWYWGYGRKPQNIIVVSLGLILLLAVSYWFNRSDILLNNGQTTELSFWDCIYFSSTTFTTLGYGDYSPTGIARIAATFESLFGVFNVGFIVAGFATNKY